MYSLRRQAMLVKMAQRHDVEPLLPYTPKLSSVKLEKRVRHGLRVRGTGVGQRPKGKQWERRVWGTLEKRREAMRRMPTLIRDWKQVSIFWRVVLWLGLGWFADICLERVWQGLEEVAEIVSTRPSCLGLGWLLRRTRSVFLCMVHRFSHGFAFSHLHTWS